MIILARKILSIASYDIDDGAILVSGAKIIDIGKRKQILKKYPAEKVVDLEDKLVMPGLVNLHAHLELSFLKGVLGEKRSFFDWIEDLVRLKKKARPKEMESAAAEALREAIRSGTTCIADVSSTEVSVPFLLKSGIRARVFLEALGLDEKLADKAFSGVLKRLEGLKGLPERVTTGISPHASYSVSVKLLGKIDQYSSDKALDIAMHLSEIKDEILYFHGKPSGMDGYRRAFGWDGLNRLSGKTPIEAVSKFGFKNMVAVHCVHPSATDYSLLKKSGASVAWCPRSNHYLGVGSAPVKNYLEKGINVGIGTDSLASNLSMDMWDEIRFAWLVSGLKASEIIKAATLGGAKALGLEGVIGSIEPGKDADLIGIEAKASGIKEPCQALISDTRPQDIAFTMVQGKAIYSKDGQTCYEF